MTNFDLKALYAALDEQRIARNLTWAAVAREVNRHVTTLRPIAASTITSLREKPDAEGDAVLQMLLWLGRTPESFVPGLGQADSERFRLREVSKGQILRWDTKALHAAINSRREARGMTWQEVTREIRGFTPGMLANLAKGGRIGFPRVMRLVSWLDEPAAAFTRVAAW